jgi:hypothetical protein
MEKQEILILKRVDLNIEGRRRWDAGESISLFHIATSREPLKKASMVLLVLPNYKMRILKSRYEIEI